MSDTGAPPNKGDSKLTTIIVALISALMGSAAGPCIQSKFLTPELEVQERQRESYTTIMTNINALYETPWCDTNRIQAVITEYHRMWIYASDETIRRANQYFMSTESTVKPPEQETADWKVAEMVLQMRKDLQEDTKLKPNDYFLLIGVIDKANSSCPNSVP